MENQNTESKNTLTQDLQSVIDNVNGGIVTPAVMYFMGVPLLLVIVLWALFFRG